MNAIITDTMLRTGSTASQINISGYKKYSGLARGHLLPSVLGGSGKEQRNLVTLYQNSVNSPIIRDFELDIKNAVQKGETIAFSSEAVYKGSDLRPERIDLKAYGNKGFKLEILITNKKIIIKL